MPVSTASKRKIRSLKAARVHFKRALTIITPAKLRATLVALNRLERLLKKRKRPGIAAALKKIERSRKGVAEGAAILQATKRWVIPQLDEALKSLQEK